MDNMKHRRLQELDRSDFEIVREDPDIRGWDVRGTNSRKVGAVEDLIVDAREKKVRYMVVDLDDNELKLRHRKVLIPIGLAELDPREDDVLSPNISAQQLSELPDYDRNSLTADVERRIFSTLSTRTEPTRVNETLTSPNPAFDAGARERNDRPEREERKNKLDKDKKERVEGEERKNRMEKEEERKDFAMDDKRDKQEKRQNEEVDPDFYRHEYYNLDNLYKNRLHEVKSVQKKQESEYERGLRLWERRSEGAVIPDDKRRETGNLPARETGSYGDLDEEQRMQMIRNRRNTYQQRRYTDRDQPDLSRDNEIERTEDEDLDDR